MRRRKRELRHRPCCHVGGKPAKRGMKGSRVYRGGHAALSEVFPPRGRKGIPTMDKRDASLNGNGRKCWAAPKKKVSSDITRAKWA